ncbi:sodium/hydrogen exchanger, partial [Genlisea aurea]
AMTGNGGAGPNKPAITSLWILLSAVTFVIFMMVIVKPAMKWIVRRNSSAASTAVPEPYICLALAGVLASAFVTDLIGIHAIFGAFVFGLAIPKEEGDFAGELTEKIEDFACCLFLPLYFASSGLKTDVSKIRGGRDVGLLALAVAAACAGKVIGSFVVAVMCRFPARESLMIGVLMNTKGLVELIVLNIGKEKKVLSEGSFTILVIMAIFTTFITTPIVMALKTRRRSSASKDGLPAAVSGEHRLLACVHNSDDVPSVVNLVRLFRPAAAEPELYILHLLTEPPSPAVKFRPWRAGGGHDEIAAALRAHCGGATGAKILLATAASPSEINRAAAENGVEMIVLPFRGQWRAASRKVVTEAPPCIVAVIVDGGREISRVESVCVVFSGGPHDRAAVKLAGNMAARITVIRFRGETSGHITTSSTEKVIIFPTSTNSKKKIIHQERDERSIQEFIKRRENEPDQYKIIEKESSSSDDELLSEIGRNGAYDLMVIGKTTPRWWPVTEGPESELGRVGDLLVSIVQEGGFVSSLLVVQSQ